MRLLVFFLGLLAVPTAAESAKGKEVLPASASLYENVNAHKGRDHLVFARMLQGGNAHGAIPPSPSSNPAPVPTGTELPQESVSVELAQVSTDSIVVDEGSTFRPGDIVIINKGGPHEEQVEIKLIGMSTDGYQLVFTKELLFAHAPGAVVSKAWVDPCAPVTTTEAAWVNPCEPTDMPTKDSAAASEAKGIALLQRTASMATVTLTACAAIMAAALVGMFMRSRHRARETFSIHLGADQAGTSCVQMTEVPGLRE